MGVGAVLEPLVVIVLLFGGTWINRSSDSWSHRRWARRRSCEYSRPASSDSLESGSSTPISKPPSLSSGASSPTGPPPRDSPWRKRRFGVFGSEWVVTSPNTTVFRRRILSCLIRKFPFLVECWYWVLIYWVCYGFMAFPFFCYQILGFYAAWPNLYCTQTYQLGRAFTAVTLEEGTVNVARKHALQVIQIEEKLGIFWEVQIQEFFFHHPQLMTWVNWLYSFIHIPGSIAFLVWLYYYTTTRNKLDGRGANIMSCFMCGLPLGPLLYQDRRRTMAISNLFAFVIFTMWPCMPPRLLSDPNVEGPEGDLSRSYGFVDTVHGVNGARSVWTENRFCNQYGAAMPSMHFGYSLMIGLTIMTIPLSPHTRRPFARYRWARAAGLHLCSWSRLVCLAVGFMYPFIILVAIVATANHFILDAVAGALVCALGWQFNGLLLNLLPVEDYFLWIVRIHKPDPVVSDDIDDLVDGGSANVLV